MRTVNERSKMSDFNFTLWTDELKKQRPPLRQQLLVVITKYNHLRITPATVAGFRLRNPQSADLLFDAEQRALAIEFHQGDHGGFAVSNEDGWLVINNVGGMLIHAFGRKTGYAELTPLPPSTDPRRVVVILPKEA